MAPLIQLLAYGVVYITYVSQMGRCILIYSGSGASSKGAGSFLRGNDPYGYARPAAVTRDRAGRETVQLSQDMYSESEGMFKWIACNEIQCSVCVRPTSARDAQLRGEENMVEPAECARSHWFTDYLENSRDYAELATFGMMRANTLLLLQLLWRHPYYIYKRPPKKTFGTLYFSRRHREERHDRPVAVPRDRSGRENGEKKEGVMNSYGSEGPELTISDNVFNELEIPVKTQEELEERLKDGDKWKELVNKAYRKKALLYHPDKHRDSSREDIRSLTSEEAAMMFRRAIDARDLLNDLDLIRVLGQRHLPRSNASSSSSSSSGSSGFPHYSPSASWEIHWSAEYQRPYFWNSRTGDSLWDRPTGVSFSVFRHPDENSGHQSMSSKPNEEKYPPGQQMFQNQLKRSLSSGLRTTCMATKAEKDKFEVSLRSADVVYKSKDKFYDPLVADKEMKAARQVKAEVRMPLTSGNKDEFADQNSNDRSMQTIRHRKTLTRQHRRPQWTAPQKTRGKICSASLRPQSSEN